MSNDTSVEFVGPPALSDAFGNAPHGLSCGIVQTSVLVPSMTSLRFKLGFELPACHLCSPRKPYNVE